MTHSVLFVCLGNICRSPMAEGAMRAAVEAREIAMHIDSAGTGSWHIGDPPDSRAQAAARANGVEISGQQARQISVSDFDRFHHILAMDGSVLGDLQAIQRPGSMAQLSLFLDHLSGREGQDVADPYYGGDDGFQATWDDVTAGAAALLDLITAH